MGANRWWIGGILRSVWHCPVRKGDTKLMTTKATRSPYERVESDFYVEPESATDRLLQAERPFFGRIVDPCCGQGNVVRSVKRHLSPDSCASCAGYDLVSRDPEFLVNDFRETLALGWSSVISNPPYNQAQEFAELALKHTTDRVCLFLRIAFLEGRKRAEWLDKTPLARIYLPADRISCTPGHLLGQKQRHGGTIFYAWFVWEHGHVGFSQNRRLPPLSHTDEAT
ncbi:hypothetical protein GS501_00110 [Saccharibacter sp. 17.LH.SD]|uniref:hypothetical protein n=1 Tax=Saccharibacter sp. 17.LH.SD TaxID=2689393 RepID=UPI0013710CCA|nr:hypothetical protein [Saccharibacter sp. 17.LH.SD]MXV43484.1 hypothetical protein [Saccharibacter sp. 17.LH.SD]